MSEAENSRRKSPEALAIDFSCRGGDFERAAKLEDFAQGFGLGANRVGLAIDLNQEMGIAGRKMLSAKMLPGGFEGKAVGELEGGGEKAFAKDALDASRGRGGIGKGGRENRARRRSGNQSQRDFGDEAEQAFRADENADEIEAALVFLRATADAHQRSVGERDLQTEDVMARHAIFQAPRTAGVGRDVPAQRAFL